MYCQCLFLIWGDVDFSHHASKAWWILLLGLMVCTTNSCPVNNQTKPEFLSLTHIQNYTPCSLFSLSSLQLHVSHTISPDPACENTAFKSSHHTVWRCSQTTYYAHRPRAHHSAAGFIRIHVGAFVNLHHTKIKWHSKVGIIWVAQGELSGRTQWCNQMIDHFTFFSVQLLSCGRTRVTLPSYFCSK